MNNDDSPAWTVPRRPFEETVSASIAAESFLPKPAPAIVISVPLS